MKSKAVISIFAVVLIGIFGFFLLRNDVKRKADIEAIELSLSLAKITKAIYTEKGVYVEILVEKGKKKYGVDFDTKKRGVEEQVKMKITPFFSQEKINELMQVSGGNLKNSKEISEIFKYAYGKVKASHPEIPELYEGSIKVIPPTIDMKKKMEDIDKQLALMEQRLKAMRSN